MGDFFKQALNLPQSQRYQLAMLLLQSLESELVQETALTEEQLASLYEAREAVLAGQEPVLDRQALKDRIQVLREQRNQAS
ncbi:MAG: hypothetical protein AAFR61_29045 [Bacteroidota bacterium]